jgi:hypothetical protein
MEGSDRRLKAKNKTRNCVILAGLVKQETRYWCTMKGAYNTYVILV